MKTVILCFAPWVMLLVCSSGFSNELRKPNLLLIYSDDHGWADLGVQGVDPDIRTPHLDQLARDGVRFTRGYVSAPQCVPSRAGLMTGRYQQRFGVEDNNRGPLPLDELTIAERLKPAGYISGWVGKCHLDIRSEKGQIKGSRLSVEHMPHRQGFDEYFRGELKQFYASHDLQGRPFPDAPHLVTDNRFRVEVQTEAALSFLERRAANPKQPWFLYLAWYAPHVPLESPEPWFSRTPPHLPKERRQAIAMIAAMDAGVGRIRAQLKAMGQEENTLIVFIGDNGAPIKAGAWNGSLNAPLIGEKGMLTDGGIRVPFLAAWPGRIPAGIRFDAPVLNLDVAATVNALAGLSPDPQLDGVNLMPYLTGENRAAPHDTLYWRWRSQAAVLEFPWKWIQLGNHDQFLFNVSQPDGELASRNQLDQFPEIARRLAEKFHTWSAMLQPPGAPVAENAQDNSFYATHVYHTGKTPLKTAAMRTANPKKDEVGTIQGWLCRNGSIAILDGALVISPDVASRGTPFLSRNALDLPGPVTLTLRVRAQQGGTAMASWRTQADLDFVSQNKVNFIWPHSTQWQTIKVELPVKGQLVHLRLILAKQSSGLEVQSIELQGSRGEPLVFRFNST